MLSPKNIQAQNIHIEYVGVVQHTETNRHNPLHKQMETQKHKTVLSGANEVFDKI